MARLRKLVLGLFWLVPLVYGLAAISLPVTVLHLFSEDDFLSARWNQHQLWLLVSILFEALLVISPIAICITSAITVVQYFRRKSSARTWAIACGGTFLMSSIPLWGAFAAIAHFGGYSAVSMDVGMLALPAIHLAVGVLLIVLFAPHSSVSELLEVHPSKIKGDGTTSFSYLLAIAVTVAGIIIFDHLIGRWAHQHGLTETPGFIQDQIIFFGALFIATAVHELGHIAAGLSVGMRMLSVRIGFLHMEVESGRWRFVPPASLKSLFQAGVRIIPPNPQQYRKSDAILVGAGGPLASLAAGAIGLLLLLRAKGSFYESAWLLLGQIAALSLVYFLANLIPVQEAATYSDGARIFQIVTGHVMEDYRRIIAVVEAGKIGPSRPRDYDISLIESTASNDLLGRHQTLYLHLIASDYYFDQMRLKDAQSALAKAEAGMEGAGTVWKENCGALVLRAVSFAQNREMAEKWWERGMNAKAFNPKSDSEFDFLAHCIIKNRLAEADGAWKRQMERTNRMPDIGEKGFDLHYLDHLRKLIDDAPVAAGPVS